MAFRRVLPFRHALAALLSGAAAAAAGAPPADRPPDVLGELDRIEWQAPTGAAADAALEPLLSAAQRNAALLHAWRATRGRLAASQRDAATTDAMLAALRRGSPTRADLAAAQTIEAIGSLARQDPTQAARQAHSALDMLTPSCGGQQDRLQPLPETPPTQPQTGPDCDARSAWSALSVLWREAIERRAPQQAAEAARAAEQLAERAADPRRQTVALIWLVSALGESDDLTAARQALARGQQLARTLDDPGLMARLRRAEANLVKDDAHAASRVRLLLEALRLAGTAGQPAVELLVLTSLSDAAVKAKAPAQALGWTTTALTLAVQRNELRTQAVLHTNAGLAHLELDHRKEALAEMDRAIMLSRQLGTRQQEAQMLREFGEAYAQAGDAATALSLFHRERTLSEAIDSADREQALQVLSTRYDAELRQRRIDAMQHDNQLQTAELANRALSQRLWALGAGVLLLAGISGGLLYWRLRDSTHQLVRSQADLRQQTERDPLTGLANRRHFHALMRAACAEPGDPATASAARPAAPFEATLLLLDIDHFKHINDTHGHAAGDAVLSCVAQRLVQTVRSEDVVARWGGEEFLICAPKLQPDQVRALVQRLLQALATHPIDVPGLGHSVTVTTSIGHMSLPLPAAGDSDGAIGWERALRLIDSALYLAKRQGRNRSVGVLALRPLDEATLAAAEADLSASAETGHAQLESVVGPAPAQQIAALRHAA